jgi:hypothetical protein
MLEDEDDDIVRWELEQIRNSGLKKGKAQEVAAASIAKRKLAGKKGGIEPVRICSPSFIYFIFLPPVLSHLTGC